MHRARFKQIWYFLCLLALSLPLCAKPLVIESKNAQTIHTNAIITHISAFDNYIFVGNTNGGIDVFSLDSNKKAFKAYSLTLPLIEDYFGNAFLPRVFDIATFDGKTLFVLSEASRGGKQILKLSTTQKPEVIYHTTTPQKRIVAFDKNKLVIGFLSNEIGLFDITDKKFIYMSHPSLAGFSDLCVNTPFILSTDESGIVNVIHSANGKCFRDLIKSIKTITTKLHLHKIRFLLQVWIDKWESIHLTHKINQLLTSQMLQV